eukprot:8854112-Pyramimonas_sp.AAC.1
MGVTYGKLYAIMNSSEGVDSRQQAHLGTGEARALVPRAGSLGSGDVYDERSGPAHCLRPAAVSDDDGGSGDHRRPGQDDAQGRA